MKDYFLDGVSVGRIKEAARAVRGTLENLGYSESSGFAAYKDRQFSVKILMGKLFVYVQDDTDLTEHLNGSVKKYRTL